MYGYALYTYYHSHCNKDIVPEAELKLLGLLPLTVSDALLLHSVLAPDEPFQTFFRQDEGERNTFTEKALKAGFAATWDEEGKEPFSALYLALLQYVERHTNGLIHDLIDRSGKIGFARLILTVLGAGRALGIHEERAMRNQHV